VAAAPTVRTSDGVDLAVETVGDGTPIVFAHEFSGDMRSWAPQIHALARSFRCVTYNARGYPPSAVPDAPDAYGQARAAADLAEIIERTAAGAAHVVGLSMGGFAALHLGLRRPDLVRSLTVAGCGYGARPEAQPQYAIDLTAEADHAEATGMAAYARQLAASGYAQCLKAKDEPGWRAFGDRLVGHSVRGMAMTLRQVLARRPSLWHLEEGLRRLPCPTLLLIGDEDTPCLEPNLFLKRVIPDAALCVLPRTGHLVNLEEPARFNDTVLGFIDAVERGRWRGWAGRNIDIIPSTRGTS
jgi:pimeloyl-ACP methyl ester carboxylesterase